MKYCPTCDARFDDEVMRFCTKDGTPLVDEEQPNFIGKPSGDLPEPAVVAADDEDEAGEVTVVRRNIAVPAPPSIDDEFSGQGQRHAERIVVPMTTEPPIDPLRNRNAVYYPPPRQNTFKVIVLTVVGTLFVLGIGALLFALLQRERGNNTNVNLNANVNANQNANYGIDTNFNFNVNSSLGSTTSNINAIPSFNANIKTPTPTPSPTTTPTPRPSPSVTPTPDELEPATPPRPTPTIDGRPRTTPTQTPPAMTRSTPRPTPHTFSTPN